MLFHYVGLIFISFTDLGNLVTDTSSESS